MAAPSLASAGHRIVGRHRSWTICERFHKTLLDEFYRVAFRKKVYDTPDALQADLDEWMAVYNQQRTHQGRWCFGKTPMQTFLDTAPLAREKQMPAKAA